MKWLPQCCFGLGGQEHDEFSHLMISSLPLYSWCWQDREYFPFWWDGQGDLENKGFILSAWDKGFFWLYFWIVRKTARRQDTVSFSVRLTQAFGDLEADHSLHHGNVSSKLSYTACAEAMESWRRHLWYRNRKMARWKCPAIPVSYVC